MIQDHKSRYKAVGIAAFSIAAGLALLRIIAYGLSFIFYDLNLSDVASETILDTIFTVLSQIVICFFVPFMVYLFCQKRTASQIFADANVKKTKWWIILLAFPMGLGCLLVTYFTNMIWLIIIVAFGYNPSSALPAYPEVFNPALFMLSIFLTGVLPALCEEFAMRGNLLNAIRGTKRPKTVIVLAALAFGLFHQNMQQFFYTAVFGGFAAFIVIKTDSIIPAVIMHFVNNTVSVIGGYGSNYGWGPYVALEKFQNTGLGAIAFILIALFIGAAILIIGTAIIVYHSRKNKVQKVVNVIYKPTLRDNAWLIGAAAIAVASTLFTFAFNVY